MCIKIQNKDEKTAVVKKNSKILLTSNIPGYSLPIMGLHQPLLSLLYTPNIMLKRIVKVSEEFTDAKLLVLHLSAFVSFLKDNSEFLESVLKDTHLKCTVESSDSLLPFRFYPKKTYMPDLFSIFCLKKKLPMTIDTSHIFSLKGNIVSFFKNNHKFINHIQLSDAGYNRRHLLLGEGVLPLLRFLQTVTESAYYG